jgi:hypothetical protein
MTNAARNLAVVLALSLSAGTVQAAPPQDMSQNLPLGDGHVTRAPSAGNVFACQTEFRNGARHDGPWFHGATWNPLEKPRVAGEILWPQAELTVTRHGEVQRVEGNSLPVGTPTGEFPITPDQPAYQYDTNPNRITEQALDFNIPARPVRAETPQCLPMGMIGFSVTGVAFYNALDDAGRDAAAHEIQDLCDGHPQGRGQYHYHSASPCLEGVRANALAGWALDGYPIMGMIDADDRQLRNADLDDCHGRSEIVVVDGRTYDYAYRLTAEYPYVMGCFTGQVLAETRAAIRDGMGPRQNGGRANRPQARRR